MNVNKAYTAYRGLSQLPDLPWGFEGTGPTWTDQTFTQQGKPVWMTGIFDAPWWGMSAANPDEEAFPEEEEEEPKPSNVGILEDVPQQQDMSAMSDMYNQWRMKQNQAYALSNSWANGGNANDTSFGTFMQQYPVLKMFANGSTSMPGIFGGLVGANRWPQTQGRSSGLFG